MSAAPPRSRSREDRNHGFPFQTPPGGQDSPPGAAGGAAEGAPGPEELAGEGLRILPGAPGSAPKWALRPGAVECPLFVDPPYISEAKGTGVPVGQKGTLQCEASAVPSAEFQWYKDDKR